MRVSTCGTGRYRSCPVPSALPTTLTRPPSRRPSAGETRRWAFICALPPPITCAASAFGPITATRTPAARGSAPPLFFSSTSPSAPARRIRARVSGYSVSRS